MNFAEDKEMRGVTEEAVFDRPDVLYSNPASRKQKSMSSLVITGYYCHPLTF